VKSGLPAAAAVVELVVERVVELVVELVGGTVEVVGVKVPDVVVGVVVLELDASFEKTVVDVVWARAGSTVDMASTAMAATPTASDPRMVTR